MIIVHPWIYPCTSLIQTKMQNVRKNEANEEKCVSLPCTHLDAFNSRIFRLERSTFRQIELFPSSMAFLYSTIGGVSA